jgi:hypothetical protein
MYKLISRLEQHYWNFHDHLHVCQPIYTYVRDDSIPYTSESSTLGTLVYTHIHMYICIHMHLHIHIHCILLHLRTHLHIHTL